MNIIAISTAFANSDVAIDFNGKKDYTSLESSAKQSENILVCLNEILQNNNVKIQDANVMSCVVGPGSFTGIRIGLGLVKGMAVANPKLKLVSVCSLDLMAFEFLNQNPKDDFWCVLDALSGNIFVAKYNSLGQRLVEPTMLTGDMLNSLDGTVVGLKSENMEFCTNFIIFSPQGLLDYTITQCNNNNFVDESNLLPIYLRKSQAEVGLENANKKN